jgi:RNA polymerase sigma factor (sigma-70 family)
MRCAPDSSASLAAILFKAANGCVARLRDIGRVPPQDADDFVQDLIVAALKRLSSYDGRRASLPTFVNRVVRNAARDLLRRRDAAKRGNGRATRSLDDLFRSRDGRRRNPGDFASDEHGGRGRRRRTDREVAELRLDLADAISKLSAQQRRLCRLLKRMSVRDATSKLKQSPSTTYRHIAEMMPHFERRDLQDYL